jgi:hypothetical protein
MTAEGLRQIVYSGADLDLDACSYDSAIFMIRRNEVDDFEGGAYIEPISANVELQLVMAIDALQRLDRISLYRTFAPVNAARVVVGLLFKSLGHARLAEGITLTLKPMIRSKERTPFHLKSPREQAANPIMDLDESDPEMPVVFPRNTAIIYKGRLPSVQRNHLYISRPSNQVAFDSFFQLGAILYLFQFTTSNSHGIRDGIEESLSGQPNILPPKENWRFVFITPPGCEVNDKATSAVEELLEGVRLYSAHLKVEEIAGPGFNGFARCIVL